MGYDRTVYVIGRECSLKAEVIGFATRAGHQVSQPVSLENYHASCRGSDSCVVLVSTSPQVDVLTLQRTADGRPELPFIVVSQDVAAKEAVQIMKAGATDLLVGPFSAERLKQALIDAFRKANRTAQRQAEKATLKPRYLSLTTREKQVISFVIGGYLNKEAAGVLGIAEITLQVHRAQIMRKMQAESLPDLVRMALMLGLAPAPRRALLERSSQRLTASTYDVSTRAKPGALQTTGV